MTLVRFEKVSLEFGHVPLLREADLAIDAGERVCLIGRNGAGKTSLLKLILGLIQPDHGEIRVGPTVQISQLEQELGDPSTHTVRELVATGLTRQRELIKRFEALSQGTLDGPQAAELANVQQAIEAHGGWSVDQQVDRVLTRLALPADQPMNTLSGGWRRRAALGRALVSNPDLLLLDEPTNHLDISTIEWLEEEIRGFPGAVLFISHDREFMQRLATRIVELDLGLLSSWSGDYQGFLQFKEQQLADEARHQALFDKKLAAEEIWVRQGIKARRTRNEGRVRSLEAMRRERAARLTRQGQARIQMTAAEESGRKVIEARHVHHGFDGKPLLQDFSLKLMRGDRLGVIGNNGVGKSTLLRILLGELPPDRGSVKLGTKLEIAYFDQLREGLDPERTVIENVGRGSDFVNVKGRDRHVISYMADFLFSAGRARTPVKALSGGERNRVILAQLFAQPANLLVMDEPTNDLDVEMLEVLEARLVEYDGTLILVSHDRRFLDNVVTSVVVFEEPDGICEYVGGYGDWAARGRSLRVVEHPQARGAGRSKCKVEKQGTPARPAARRQKMSFKLQRELDGLPERIEALEARVEQLSAAVSDPGFYAQPRETVDAGLADLARTQAELEAAMERWGELEELGT